MPKPKVVGAARRTLRRLRTNELSEAVEGQIAEICRDVAVQVKRMHQLQQQTDDLRTVIREWAREFEPPSDRAPATDSADTSSRP